MLASPSLGKLPHVSHGVWQFLDGAVWPSPTPPRCSMPLLHLMIIDNCGISASKGEGVCCDVIPHTMGTDGTSQSYAPAAQRHSFIQIHSFDLSRSLRSAELVFSRWCAQLRQWPAGLHQNCHSAALLITSILWQQCAAELQKFCGAVASSQAQ